VRRTISFERNGTYMMHHGGVLDIALKLFIAWKLAQGLHHKQTRRTGQVRNDGE
jgi:hypothetical protein